MGGSLFSGAGLINLVFGIYIFILMLRFALHASLVDQYNPLVESVLKATNWLVNPIQSVLRPIAGRFSIATVVAAIIVKMIALALSGFLGFGIVPLLVLSLASAIEALLQVYFYALILLVIMSWVAPKGDNPAAVLVWQLTEPVMAPLRRVIPPIGMFDLSPIVAFILINLLQHGVTVAAQHILVSIAS